MIPLNKKPKQALIFGSLNHVLSDFLFALMVPILILIKDDPNLPMNYTQIGVIRMLHTGSAGLSQIPFGLITNLFNEGWLIIVGNAWVTIGLIILSYVQTYPSIVFISLVGGIGGGAQHPLATNLVSRSYENKNQSTAIGTVNFAGDIGKILAPLCGTFILATLGWRKGLKVTGISTLIFIFICSLSVLKHFKYFTSKTTSNKIPNIYKPSLPFIVLCCALFIDSGIRTAAITFIPFALKSIDLDTDNVLFLLTSLLIGGAIGKILCGWLNERYNFISIVLFTKGTTALIFFMFMFSDKLPLLPLMFILGLGLNGTSSILYGQVGKTVSISSRSSSYAYLYTVGEIGSAVFPFLIGIISDVYSITLTNSIFGFCALIVIAVSFFIKDTQIKNKI
ncbi:MAG: hypothetical protein CL768_04110 [Chloroflexi bacterium]|nr:hypothetical protein [Chloroflexota bacterium]